MIWRGHVPIFPSAQFDAGISAIGEDVAQPGQTMVSLGENGRRAIAVLAVACSMINQAGLTSPLGRKLRYPHLWRRAQLSGVRTNRTAS